MMIKKRVKFAIFGFLVLLLALFPVGSVFAAGLGHGFYGTVKVDGANADVGTVIRAEVAGTECGDCEVTTAGQYALIVQDGIADGATIDFYVDGDKADQTFPFHDGWTTELNLTVGVPGPLVADAGGPYSGTAGESVSLSGSATGGISPYSYAWDLDDDGVYDDSYIQNPSYTWDAAGNYTVSLEVTDDVGDTDTDTASVSIAPPGPLVADAGGPYTGTVDESVRLSGSATGGTSPYSYAWDLDDDGAYDDSTARTPSYTWDAAGDYTVGLEVTDDVGDTDTDTASVDIRAVAPPGVGGTAYPPDKLSLLAPWIALGVGLAVLGWFLVTRRRAYR